MIFDMIFEFVRNVIWNNLIVVYELGYKYLVNIVILRNLNLYYRLLVVIS